MDKFDNKGKVPEGNHNDMRGGAVETMYVSFIFHVGFPRNSEKRILGVQDWYIPSTRAKAHGYGERLGS